METGASELLVLELSVAKQFFGHRLGSLLRCC